MTSLSAKDVAGNPRNPRLPLPFLEFIALLAAFQALTALGVDAMLPALPEMGRALGVSNQNSLQWIVTVYVMGSACGQLMAGILADWFGRRPIALAGIVGYAALAATAALVGSFDQLLLLRFLQGVMAAAPQTVARAIIRDRAGGNEMARILSFISMVFMIVPILAPSLGQLILLFGHWGLVFAMLGASAAALFLWTALRLPETRAKRSNSGSVISQITRSVLFVARDRASFFCTLGVACMFGSGLTFVSTMPQIFETVFHRSAIMPEIFALCASTMAAASLLNARIVRRFGSVHMITVALPCGLAASAAHLVIALSGAETLFLFTLCQSLTMGCFTLSVANLNALSMHRMGLVAGTAASIQGVLTSLGAVVIASIAGHTFSGSIAFLPLAVLLCGSTALAGFLFAKHRGAFEETPDLPELAELTQTEIAP